MLTELQKKKLTYYFHAFDVDKNGFLEESDFDRIVDAYAEAYKIPNLACQAVIHSGIVPTTAPEEFVNYGCAAGFFPLNSAIKYCQHNEKAAIVIVFDQCNARIGSSCYDPNDPIFEKVLSAFAKPEILGLSNAQIARSKEFFENFGNMSSPSCFLVFDSFFKEKCKDKLGELGIVVGFGAGLYQFSLLYRWT
jgi:predicted naringenin-chalcone synthase